MTIPTRAGGPLDDVNDAFHYAYDEARRDAAGKAPVFVLLADSLVIFHRGDRRELTISPRDFHVIKSVAHVAVAIYATLLRAAGARFGPSTADQLRAIRTHVVASAGALPEGLAHEVATDLRATLAVSTAFIDRVLDDGRISSVELEAFARQRGPCLVRLTDHATRLELAALHARVEEALAALDAEERRLLQVVVAGDHQARVRSLGMQYFQKRFGEPEGLEERVTYGEAVANEAEALALVGTRRLDRAVAHAFFGDARRLQRDVLGDAGRHWLAQLDLPLIE